jgi:hypothetical protein
MIQFFVMTMPVIVASRQQISGICRSIKFEGSAVLFVGILGLAITSPFCRPAAM